MTIKERAIKLGIVNPNELQMRIVQQGGRVTQETTRAWWETNQRPHCRNRILLAMVFRIPLSELESWWPTPKYILQQRAQKFKRLKKCVQCGHKVDSLSIHEKCRRCEIGWDHTKGGGDGVGRTVPS